jgi:hypothetical protein
MKILIQILVRKCHTNSIKKKKTTYSGVNKQAHGVLMKEDRLLHTSAVESDYIAQQTFLFADMHLNKHFDFTVQINIIYSRLYLFLSMMTGN